MSSSVLVLGGGLAGAAAATLLARRGIEVTLVEQYAEPRHKVCGEFLSAEACQSLLSLGLDVRALGAVPVRHLRFVRNRRSVGCDLPFEAQSLTRCVLDEAMLQLASRSGVTLARGETAESLQHLGDEWHVRLSGGRLLRAPDVFLASGKHDLRGHARPLAPLKNSRSLIAFKQYFRLSPDQAAALNHTVELILYRGGYAGLQLVESGCANLCLLVDAARYKQLGGNWASLLTGLLAGSDHLARRLHMAEPLLSKPLTLSRIPYGFLRTQPSRRGLWHLGDQAAVIPSFSGDGMSIALHTASLAAETYLRGSDSAELARRLDRDLRPLMLRANTLSRLLLSGTGQRIASAAVQVMPSLLAHSAALTRIPPSATAKLALSQA